MHKTEFIRGLRVSERVHVYLFNLALFLQRGGKGEFLYHLDDYSVPLSVRMCSIFSPCSS